MSAVTTQRRPVSIDELKRAWAAVQDGQFRHGAASIKPPAAATVTARGPAAAGEWITAAGGSVLPVVGCSGSVGATTIALAIAVASPRPTRVVECCSVTASGLAAASNAELGLHPSGWRRGKRDQVLLERSSEVLLSVSEVPAPTAAERDDQLTVLDTGWELGQIFAIPGWLGETVRGCRDVVLVTSATVPGFRRLEGALELLQSSGARPAVAVIGPHRKKWPKAVEHSAGAQTRRVLVEDRIVEVPHDRALAVSGLDSTPLPALVTEAATRLLELTRTADPGHEPA